MPTKTENEENNESSSPLQKFTKRTKPLRNEPFIKNLFCGNYIYEYLQFPEYTTNQELDDLNNIHVQPIGTYLTSTSREKIQSGSNFTREALDAFKQLGVFGQSMPRAHNGLELDSTSVTRILEECASSGYANLAMHLIYSNEIAAKSIQQFGSLKQQEKYLRRLCDGDLRAGFGFSELKTGIDSSRFGLTATRTSSNENYTLNGDKCWVSLLTSTSSPTDHSDFVLVVVAKTIEPNDETSLTAFVLDANTPGKYIYEPID